jgi:hypothetical protein
MKCAATASISMIFQTSRSTRNYWIGEELLDLASHIIETKKARFDPEKFKDHYQEAVVDLIRGRGGARCYAWWIAGGRPAMMQQCNRRLRWQPSDCQLSLQGSKRSTG